MLRLIASLAAFVLAALPPAHAQETAAEYPSRTIKIVVPFAPGGGSDFIARVIGKSLQGKWGKPVIVENRPGAGSTIGSAYALKSPGDGYTLLLASASYAVNPTVYKNLPYNSLGDMKPVIVVAQNPTIVCVNPALPVKTLKDLIDYAKANPDKIAYASSGAGGLVHLNTEGFMLETGTKMLHVPYRGSGPSAMAVLAGEVQLFVGDAGSTYPHVQAGTLRALAVAGKERFPLLPNIPTLTEAGFTAFDMPIWQGLIAPQDTPDTIVQKLNAEINALLQTDEFKQAISAQLFVPAGGTPAAFHDLIKSDMERWEKVVKAANVTVAQ